MEYVFDATPVQRRSYARFILAGNGEGNYDLRAMAEWEPESLRPWADHVALFDDAALGQLTSRGWPDYWWATLGASDASVDDLAARIAAAPPTEPYMPTTCTPPFARVYLLIGADTDRALTHLGDLGRERQVVRWICENNGLAVPPTGSAVRRFTRTPQIIADRYEPTPGLRTDIEAADILADPRGVGCALPLSVVLEVDLSLLDSPLKGTFPFFMSFCSDCEADEEILGYRGWKRDTDKIVFDEERDERCPGYDEGTPDPLTDVGLRPSHRYDPQTRLRSRSRDAGRLGGRPSWRQYPDWPGCCGQPMFFVGQIDIGHFGGVGGTSHAFACECGTATQLTQIS
ncbi:hypothetical protein [Actinocrispum sp. NPDC049592]|uniref:hypothetical protein n=1 Tax=Actinocrispum sp. NPDC049592 TaxID=3154835 RepID=UPI00344101D6